MSTVTYQDEAPSRLQQDCPHRLITRTTKECASCGSRKKANGRWEYLTLDWHRYYQTGDNRPGNQ